MVTMPWRSSPSNRRQRMPTSYFIWSMAACNFFRLSDATKTAEDVLSRLLHIDEFGRPVFSTPDC
ncbi:hypothetical protein D9M68_372690 [compost metagenome]